MDLKTLFHNPGVLTDAELGILRNKIRIQRSIPGATGIFGGVAMLLFDSAILRRSVCKYRVGTAAILGYFVGCYGVMNFTTTTLHRKYDLDIMNAYDRRYMNTVLNTSGFGSNYLSSADYSENAQLKKPY